MNFLILTKIENSSFMFKSAQHYTRVFLYERTQRRIFN